MPHAKPLLLGVLQNRKYPRFMAIGMCHLLYIIIVHHYCTSLSYIMKHTNVMASFCDIMKVLIPCFNWIAFIKLI